MREGAFPTFKDTGLRFAAVVSDYNPIHLYPATAKLFGFKRPIAHGMFVAAKVFHEALAEWAKAGALVHGRAGAVLAYVQYAMSHHKHIHTHPQASRGPSRSI